MPLFLFLLKRGEGKIGTLRAFAYKLWNTRMTKDNGKKETRRRDVLVDAIRFVYRGWIIFVIYHTIHLHKHN
jgi:hypothetical protein